MRSECQKPRRQLRKSRENTSTYKKDTKICFISELQFMSYFIDFALIENRLISTLQNNEYTGGCTQ